MYTSILKSFFLFPVLFICTTLYAQQNFEGKIVYAGNFLGKDEITVFFGKDKLLTKTNPIDSINGNNKDFLIDFTKGVVYYIDRLFKTYSRESITDSRSDLLTLVPSAENNTIILGYNCSAYRLTGQKGHEQEKDPFYFFYADTLLYHVKEEYTRLQGLQFFTNGANVGMGFQTAPAKFSDDKKMGLIPVSVAAEIIPDSIFSLSGFKIYDITVTDTEVKEDAEAIEIRAAADSAVKAAADSAVKVIDSIIRAMEKMQGMPTKSNPQKSSPKNTHSPSTKSPAIKPKH